MKTCILILSSLSITQGYAAVYECPNIPGEIHIEGNTAHLMKWGRGQIYAGTYAVLRSGLDIQINYNNDWSVELKRIGPGKYAYYQSKGYESDCIVQDEEMKNLIIENESLKRQIKELKSKVEESSAN